MMPKHTPIAEIAKYKLGQHFAAIADYDIAIRLNPDDAVAYVSRGAAKSDLGQHLAAIADYDTAIRLKPDDANAYNNRGIAKGKLGQHFAAIADYDITIRLKPDYASSILQSRNYEGSSSVNTLPPSQIMISPSA